MLVPLNLRKERFDRGMTIKALSEHLGVSRRTIERLEEGMVPYPPTAKIIADWLGTKPSVLWPEFAERAA